MRKFLLKNINQNSCSRILFIYSLCFLSFAFGYLSYADSWFPHRIIVKAITFVQEIENPKLDGHNLEIDYTKAVPTYDQKSAYNGLSLVSSRIENRNIAASVINMDGDLIHRWDIDWFDLWPKATHISKSDPTYPKSKPGTHIHGAVLLENGDLIFNFEYLGMVRLDICGNVIWRLPYRTHHSIYQDEDGHLWVPSRIVHDEPLPDLPYHKAPVIEPTVLKVSLDGKVLKEISVFELLQKNDLQGLLNFSSLGNEERSISGDTLHLNDVETFPKKFDEGVFRSGDIMISLRNINTILIFKEEDLQVTHVSTGTFVRQHDPDFIDGNTISVYDNYNIGPENYGHQSRILIKSFADDQETEYFSGNADKPFYSSILGKHQWLPNGNLLITESKQGRAFEIDHQGNIIWEYINILRPGYAGIVENVQRLPDIFTEEYFDQLHKQCDVEEKN